MKQFYCNNCNQLYLQNLNEQYICSRCSSRDVINRNPSQPESSIPRSNGTSTQIPVQFTADVIVITTFMPDGSFVVTQSTLYRPFYPESQTPQMDFDASTLAHLAGFFELISNPAQQQNTGAAPASEVSINSLQTIEKKDTNGVCPICLDKYKETEKIRKMPCSHDFHDECLVTWLKVHNTCPICRFALNEPAKVAPVN